MSVPKPDALSVALAASIGARFAQSGLTRQQLAAASEIDDRQLSRVLAGRGGLSLHSLARLARALGCHSADLLRESESPAAVRRPKRRQHAHAA